MVRLKSDNGNFLLLSSCRDTSYEMTDMFLKITKRLLLQVYFVAFAALPLSYIHVEDTRGTCSFTAGAAHQGHNVHVLLHQIFFTHFSNRSDHLRLSPADKLLGTEAKIVLQKAQGTPSFNGMPASADTRFISVPVFAVLAAAAGIDTLSTRDFASRSSGLSPPDVERIRGCSLRAPA